MEFREVIEKRKTIRDFKNKEVSKTIIDYALENGFKAPTYNHLRDWDFIIINSLESKLKIIESENLEKLVDILELERLFKNKEPIMKQMYLDAIPKQKKMILEAPSVIIVVFKPKTKIGEAKRIYDLSCLASVWACIENFLLSLAEHNVYGVTFIPQNIEIIKEKLGIPNGLEIASIIPIGYNADDTKILEQKTINIAEKKHYERW